MAGNVPSLGDDLEPKRRLVREAHELPKQRKDLLGKFEQILSSGGVQRIVIQVGKPIVVDRIAKENEPPSVPFELPEEDLFLAARNAPIGTAYVDPKWGPFEYLAVTFDLLAAHGAVPRAFYVDRVATLQEWLKRPCETLFGVEVRESGEMSPDSGLLIGVDPNDSELVLHSIRFEISIPKKKKEKKP